MPIVAAANAVIERASQRHAKTLRSSRASAERPVLATVDDEHGEVDYVIERVLAHREAGLALRDQDPRARSPPPRAASEVCRHPADPGTECHSLELAYLFAMGVYFCAQHPALRARFRRRLMGCTLGRSRSM